VSSARHTEGKVCPSCDEKLKTAHPDIAAWFRDVKRRHQNVHVSWAWRGADAQNKAYFEGKSNCPFPKSPHNHTEGGKPCSLALDLFLITEEGEAVFPAAFYKRLNAENEAAKIRMIWGGHFKSLGDAGHFQIPKPEPKLRSV
jgi:hypothetical protein